jgi:hypothetical protein
MSAHLVKVKESSELVKDITSGAVLNTNVKALAAYRAKRLQSSKIDTLEKDVQELSRSVNELKELIIASLGERINGKNNQ